MPFDPSQRPSPGAKIKVIGIGGGGSNAVNTMISSQIEGVDFVSVNTDIQSLKESIAPTKLQIGKELTKGLGAGADPDVGRDAALEDRHEIQESLIGADMVFITAGMGGGTGTGGASVVSQIAKDQGALTVGVVTKPFHFEGKKRRKHALAGIERIRQYVDTLIVIPNQRLLQIATPDLSLVNAFKMVDTVLVNAVKGISDIINIPGTINVDFADVKTIMSSTGQALMGIGTAEGENRAIEAANKAISSPLLEDIDIEGATGILINISASESISLLEANEACSIIQDAAHEDANIIFGTVIDDNMGKNLRVTVIATGFPGEKEESKTNIPTHDKGLMSKNAHTPKEIQPHDYMVQNVSKVTEEFKQDSESSITNSVNTKAQGIINSETEELAMLTMDSLQQTSLPNNDSFSTINKHDDSFIFNEESSIIDPDLTNDSHNYYHQDLIGGQENLKKDNSRNTSVISDEIDQKIDEALQIAERVNHVRREDRLDIPTYLRDNDKELKTL